MLIGCAPEPQPSQLDAIQERGVLRVGTLLGPTSYYLDAEAEAGFEYHLVRRFADRLGVELEIVPRYNINHLFDLLNAGDVDLLAAGLNRTPQREQRFRFGPPYMEVDRKSTRLNSSHVRISYAVFCLKKKKTNNKLS